MGAFIEPSGSGGHYTVERVFFSESAIDLNRREGKSADDDGFLVLDTTIVVAIFANNDVTV